jgi:Domain of unknown function (DUF5666)
VLIGRCPSVVFVIKTTTIIVDSSTDFRKGDCSDLRAGVNVSVTGTLQSDDKVLATKIEFKKK